jgi:hypothetical protein
LKVSLHKKKSIGSDQLFQWLVSFIPKEEYVEYFFNIKSFIEIPGIKEKNIHLFPLGLKKGLAGYLLDQII